MSAVTKDASACVSSANFCDPPEPAFGLYTRLYRGAMRARGTDPDIAPRLPRLLRAVGFTGIGWAIHQPASVEPGDIKRLVALTLDSVAGPAVDAGLATPAEVSAASERLHAMAGEADAFMSMPRVVQAWGHKGPRPPGSRTRSHDREGRMTGRADPLIGTWTLTSWRNETEDGSSLYPLGEGASGYISYSPDGFVFVQLTAAGRPPYAGGDPFGGTAEEDSTAIKSQIAYAGPYTFHGDHVVHHVTQATFPNWVGTQQRRDVHLDGDHLRLSAAGALFRGQVVTALVDWRRVRPLHSGTPE